MKLNIDRTNWKKVKLGDVAFEYSKRINNPSDSEFDRFVGSSNIEQWDFRVKSWENTSSVTSAMKLFEPDDYLLVRRSLYASDFRERAPRAHFYGVCSGDILTIKENPEMIVDGFLIGILNSPALWKYIVANGSGSITRRIHWKDLANYEFLLPPKAEQAKLAELLWAMDEVIEKEKRVLEGLERVMLKKKELYFIKGNNSTLKKKFLSFDIPFHWDLKKISEVAQVEYGISESVANNFDSNIGWQIITGANINLDGTLDLTKKRYIEVPTNERFLLEQGDLLFNWRSGSPEHIGKTAIFNLEGNFTYASFILRIRCFNELRNRFGFYLLNYMREVDFFTKNTAQQINFKLNASIFRDIYMPIPPIEEQLKIEETLDIIYSKILEVESKIKLSQSLQKSLINQIF